MNLAHIPARSATYRHITGITQLREVLALLPADMAGEILGRATKEAIQPIKVAAKRFAKRSEDTGALRASITDKVKVYPQSGKAVGLVGPDRAYYRRGKKVGKLGALFWSNKPANYAHLVEYGHVAVAPKRGTSLRKNTARRVGFVPAKPFIRPAVVTTLAEQIAAFTRGIEIGLNESIRKRQRAA
jgi:hypothetical protein